MKLHSSQTTAYLLIAILVTAAILRLNHINQPFTDAFSWRQSDDAIMADNFYRGNWNILYPGISWNGPEPNYQGMEFQTITYIAALLYVVVGQHDWVGRGVALAFGLWGIFALFQLVRRVWDERLAIVSAAVMALLPGSIFIERSFLPDPAMVALVVTSFWMLVAYFQTERLHYLILAGVIGMWGFLTKIPGLIVGLPMAYATLAILGPKRTFQSKKLIALGTFAFLTLVPVISYYLWARHISLTYSPYYFAAPATWLWDHSLTEWLSQSYFLPRLSNCLKIWMWTPPVIFLVLLGLLIPPPKEKSGQEYISDQTLVNLSGKAPWLFHWWFFAGVVYYFIGAQELVSNPWNFHIINPAAAALAGHAIIAIASFTTRIARSSVAIVIIVLLLLIIGTLGQKVLKYMYHPYSHEGYKLGLALHQITQPDDLVVTITGAIGDPVAIYYSQRRGWIFPPVWAWRQPSGADGLFEDDNKTIRLLEELRSNGADWLGIVNEQIDGLRNNHPLLIEHIERTCELKAKSPEWVIYRILTSEELTRLPGQTLKKLP